MAAMLPVPKVFIGSSHEGRDVAYAIQHHLEGRIAETTVWDQGLFNLSNTSISSLVDIMHRFDFAIFAMCADDITVLRGERVVTARDNVIFELGLAIAGMGLDKTYMVVPDGIIDFHLPTDLLGLIYARYNSHRSDGNLRTALGPACSLIEDAIRRFARNNKRKRGAADSFPFAYSSAICYQHTPRGTQFLLVKSDQGRRIFPNGKIGKNDPQEMANRYAHDEAGVYGSIKAVEPIIYRHFKEEDGEEHLIGGFIIEVFSNTGRFAPFREPKWYDVRAAVAEVSKLRPFVYAQEMRRVLREAYDIIEDRFQPVLQCAAIPFRRTDGKTEILMVTSLGRKTWILPKGNVDSGSTPQLSAAKEAFEEAGVKGIILDEHVGTYMYRKDNITTCQVDVYSLEVQEELAEWPDHISRSRQWFSADTAITRAEDDGLKQLLIDFRRTVGE